MYFTTLLGADPSPLGRVDYASMPQQSLMELVISQMSAENQEEFEDTQVSFCSIIEWPGVTTIHNGSVVTSIDWDIDDDDIGMEMPENQGTILLEWLPATVEKFRLSGRGFGGIIDCAKLPRSLHSLSAPNNRFTGGLKLADLPETLVKLNLSSNYLSRLDIRNLSKNVAELHLFRNPFEGSLEFPADHEKIQRCFIGTNRLSGTLNTACFPKSLTHLVRYKAKLEGPIDLTVLPSSVGVFNLRENALTGEITLSKLHHGMRCLELANNRLHGSIDFTTLPRTLTTLGLSNNAFSGDVNLSNLPPHLVTLRIDNNAFDGSLHIGKIPGSLEKLCIERNAFSKDTIQGFRNMPFEDEEISQEWHSVVLQQLIG